MSNAVATKRSSKRAGTRRPRLRKIDRALIIVGGHEDKEGDRDILKEVARRTGNGTLVVATVASSQPGKLWETYEPLFRRLGVRHLRWLDISSRAEATDPGSTSLFEHATAVFFTGGDQLKITSQLGDTPVFGCIRDLYEAGGTVAGTSAGAAVMTETMLVSGNGDESARIGSGALMAPGLGLLPNAIVDQHFAERGRLGRLLGAVAQNPRIIGIGIDEDTAIVVERNRCRVLGSGAVYFVDGRHTTHSNLTEEAPDRALSVFDVKLHVLTDGDVFHLGRRRPVGTPAEVAAAVTERESRSRPGR